MTTAAARAMGKRLPAIRELAKQACGQFPTRPGFEALFAFVNRNLSVDWIDDGNDSYPIHTVFAPPAEMQIPPAALAALKLPAFATTAALAGWLGVTPGRLDWLADPSGRNRLHRAGPLRTYRYRWVPKPGRRWRLLEIPTPLLKRLQRKLLEELLNLVPAHETVHGFRPGRSAITNATPHCGREVVITFDLVDFFQSVRSARVFALFSTLGYPGPVARRLAGLCTTRLPADVWNRRPDPPLDGSDYAKRQRYHWRHLPQGAPTSPALANLVAYRFDCRLAGLAAKLGATYTRYADDLTFSGGADLARCAKRFAHHVAVIALEEGFTLNYRKTRVLRRGGRQSVTGVVVNERPNVPRADFDRLKAILTNCARHGPAGQNWEQHRDFRAHLAGKVAYLAAIHAARGQKRRAIFDRIAWPDA